MHNIALPSLISSDLCIALLYPYLSVRKSDRWLPSYGGITSVTRNYLIGLSLYIIEFTPTKLLIKWPKTISIIVFTRIIIVATMIFIVFTKIDSVYLKVLNTLIWYKILRSEVYENTKEKSNATPICCIAFCARDRTRTYTSRDTRS